MNIYIACPYPERHYALVVRKFCLGRGWQVCARWLDPSHDGLPAFQTPELQRIDALEDMQDIASCDVMLVLSPLGYAERGTGGRHVELGIAIGLGKRIVLLGDPTNVFHRLPSIVVIPDHAPASELTAAILGTREIRT